MVAFHGDEYHGVEFVKMSSTCDDSLNFPAIFRAIEVSPSCPVAVYQDATMIHNA